MIEHEPTTADASPAPPIESVEQPGRINPELYINRELSWIEFNRRVLEEAQDARNPLLERIKFTSIFSSNLDEFFMIRVSGIREQIEAGVSERSPNGKTPHEQLEAIRTALLPQLAERQRLLTEELLPALHAEGIHVLRYEELNVAQREALHSYYAREIFPVLTPLAIDPSHPFPFISNLSLNLAVAIDDPNNGQLFARVKVPEGLPRLVQLPAETCEGEARNGRAPVCFVWLEEIIAANLGTLFSGKRVRAVYAFRVTRDADMEIQEDEAGDLLQTMEQNVRQRRFGRVVRLTIDAQMSPQVRRLLVDNLELTDEDVYTMSGPLGLSSLMSLLSLDRPELKDPPFIPAVPAALRFHEDDIFAAIRQRDILLHHPYDSFAPVIDVVKAAAADPQVLAIKQTLYRTGRNSPIVAALMEAREEGKQVATLVELKARFDEENNIGWAKQLESAGVHVVYGLLGLKVHAKLLLIVRKEADGIRRYVHLGTGNYNASTARLYTDFGLLTCDQAIGEDVSELFNALTGYSDQQDYRKLLVAPGSMRKALLAKIEREISCQRRGRGGHMILKCNALTDEEITMALYRASQAGVRVDLIVRGICSLRPGIPGLSETVQVRSIIGRFLEHHRAYYFRNGGDEELYLGSADLMVRNISRRVETLFPIQDAAMLRYLRDTVLQAYLDDTTHARLLQPDGGYARPSAEGRPPFSSQLAFFEPR
jgi:polyphosphate kinase